MKAIYLFAILLSVSTSWVQCKSKYFIVPLFVFDKHITLNIFSTKYKLQVRPRLIRIRNALPSKDLLF